MSRIVSLWLSRPLFKTRRRVTPRLSTISSSLDRNRMAKTPFPHLHLKGGFVRPPIIFRRPSRARSGAAGRTLLSNDAIPP
jgi:hypothetical protein